MIFKRDKDWYPNYNKLYNVLKGTVENRTSHSINGELLEIMISWAFKVWVVGIGPPPYPSVNDF